MKKKALLMVVLLTMIGASGVFAQKKNITKVGDVFVKNALVSIVPYMEYIPLRGMVDLTRITVKSEATTGPRSWDNKTFENNMKANGSYNVRAGWEMTGWFKLDIDYGGGSSAIVYSMGGTIKSKLYKDNHLILNLELVDSYADGYAPRVSIDNSGRSSLLLSFISCVQTDKIERFVNGLKKSGQSKDELADLVISKKSVKGGFLGAIAGIGGTIAAPVNAVGELNKMCVKAEMAYAIAYVYGYTPRDMEFENDLAILLGDDSAVKSAIKSAAGLTPKDITKTAFNKITQPEQEALKQKLTEAITKKLGASVTKGALGAIKVAQSAIDTANSYSDAKQFGEKAKKYYKN